MKLQQQMFDLVEQQRIGTIGVGAFCQQHGLTYAKFYYWRRRWEAHQVSYEASQGEQCSPTGFVQLQPTDSQTDLCLDLPDGSRLCGTARQLATFYHQLQLLGHA